MKWNIKALALSLGIVWGFAQLMIGWAASFGWGGEYVRVMASIYIGFKPGFLGGIIGAMWGFSDAVIGGLIFGFLYNWFTKEK